MKVRLYRHISLVAVCTVLFSNETSAMFSRALAALRGGGTQATKRAAHVARERIAQKARGGLRNARGDSDAGSARPAKQPGKTGQKPVNKQAAERPRQEGGQRPTTTPQETLRPARRAPEESRLQDSDASWATSPLVRPKGVFARSAEMTRGIYAGLTADTTGLTRLQTEDPRLREVAQRMFSSRRHKMGTLESDLPHGITRLQADEYEMLKRAEERQRHEEHAFAHALHAAAHASPYGDTALVPVAAPVTHGPGISRDALGADYSQKLQGALQEALVGLGIRANSSTYNQQRSLTQRAQSAVKRLVDHGKTVARNPFSSPQTPSSTAVAPRGIVEFDPVDGAGIPLIAKSYTLADLVHAVRDRTTAWGQGVMGSATTFLSEHPQTMMVIHEAANQVLPFVIDAAFRRFGGAGKAARARIGAAFKKPKDGVVFPDLKIGSYPTATGTATEATSVKFPGVTVLKTVNRDGSGTVALRLDGSPANRQQTAARVLAELTRHTPSAQLKGTTIHFIAPQSTAPHQQTQRTVIDVEARPVREHIESPHTHRPITVHGEPQTHAAPSTALVPRAHHAKPAVQQQQPAILAPTKPPVKQQPITHHQLAHPVVANNRHMIGRDTMHLLERATPAEGAIIYRAHIDARTSLVVSTELQVPHGTSHITIVAEIPTDMVTPLMHRTALRIGRTGITQTSSALVPASPNHFSIVTLAQTGPGPTTPVAIHIDLNSRRALSDVQCMFAQLRHELALRAPGTTVKAYLVVPRPQHRSMLRINRNHESRSGELVPYSHGHAVVTRPSHNGTSHVPVAQRRAFEPRQSLPAQRPPSVPVARNRNGNRAVVPATKSPVGGMPPLHRNRRRITPLTEWQPIARLGRSPIGAARNKKDSPLQKAPQKERLTSDQNASKEPTKALDHPSEKQTAPLSDNGAKIAEQPQLPLVMFTPTNRGGTHDTDSPSFVWEPLTADNSPHPMASKTHPAHLQWQPIAHHDSDTSAIRQPTIVRPLPTQPHPEATRAAAQSLPELPALNSAPPHTSKKQNPEDVDPLKAFFERYEANVGSVAHHTQEAPLTTFADDTLGHLRIPKLFKRALDDAVQDITAEKTSFITRYSPTYSAHHHLAHELWSALAQAKLLPHNAQPKSTTQPIENTMTNTHINTLAHKLAASNGTSAPEYRDAQKKNYNDPYTEIFKPLGIPRSLYNDTHGKRFERLIEEYRALYPSAHVARIALPTNDTEQASHGRVHIGLPQHSNDQLSVLEQLRHAAQPISHITLYQPRAASSARLKQFNDSVKHAISDLVEDISEQVKSLTPARW